MNLAEATAKTIEAATGSDDLQEHVARITEPFLLAYIADQLERIANALEKISNREEVPR